MVAIVAKSQCCDSGMAKNADGFTEMLRSGSTRQFADCRDVASGEICELVVRQGNGGRLSSLFVHYFGGCRADDAACGVDVKSSRAGRNSRASSRGGS